VELQEGLGHGIPIFKHQPEACWPALLGRKASFKRVLCMVLMKWRSPDEGWDSRTAGGGVVQTCGSWFSFLPAVQRSP
jgi:hypothetical protein